MRNRVKKVMLPLLAVILLCSCGQKADYTLAAENNATSEVTVGEDVYAISGQTVTRNGAVMAEDIGASEEKIIVLGGKVYFNTDEGTKYISPKNGKIKKFGKGRAIYGKGEWIYYENIGLYRVNLADGQQGLLHETALEFKDETDEGIVFTDGEKEFLLKDGADELEEL